MRASKTKTRSESTPGNKNAPLNDSPRHHPAADTHAAGCEAAGGGHMTSKSFPSKAKRVVVPTGDRILRNHDLDVITGLSRTTRWRLERDGKFPARRRLSSMAVGWLESEVNAFLSTLQTA
jgi:prophage regulatory protein